MRKTIRFGGRPSITATPAASSNSLAALLGELSWKYVKQEAEFDPNRSVTDVSPDKLRQKVAGWAARV